MVVGNRAVGHALEKQSSGRSDAGSAERSDAGVDGTVQRAVRADRAGSDDGRTADPAADLCPRCVRRYRRGESLDCAECESTLERDGERSDRGAEPERVQPNLTVTESNDETEREAERVAGGAIGQPTAGATGRPQNTASGDGSQRVDDETAAQIESLRGTGDPLSPLVRSFFEPRLGRDFSDVRVHTGSKAAEVARSIDAQAFTVGNDVVFKDGAFRPESSSGRELIAHELAHVVQQRGKGAQPHNSTNEPSPDRLGSSLSRGAGVTGSQELIQRQTDVGVDDRDAGYGPPAGKPAQRADTPPHPSSGKTQGHDTSIGQILDNFFSSSSTEKMWVMREGDNYTQIVRKWDPVINAVDEVKDHLQSNCVTWKLFHTTDPSWNPGKTDPPKTDPNAYDEWVSKPPGTKPETCAEAFSKYMATKPVPFTRGYQSFELYTCSIGSFGIYATVDSIDCANQTAELNVWMYNAMDRDSFGRFAKYFPMSGMKRQYMWWNWSESHSWGSSRGGGATGTSGESSSEADSW